MNKHLKYLPSPTSLCSSVFHFSILGFLFLFNSCDFSGDDSKVLKLKKPIPEKVIEKIEPDSGLFRLNVEEWNAASEAEQKANCAAIILTSVESIEFKDKAEFNELSEELCSCISDLTKGMPTMNDNALFDEAQRCLASMGYREESDSLSIK